MLEEPELSLHDAIVHALPPMIARMQRQSGRQVIATTHSEALVAADGIGLHEVHRLEPGDNDTTIETSGDNAKVRQLVEAGFSVGEAVMPFAKPQKSISFRCSMSSPVEIHTATEGVIAAVARRLIEHVGAKLGMERPAGGKSRLDSRIPKYNEAARHQPWLVLRDLDDDAMGPSTLVSLELGAAKSPSLRFRIAVRAIESWLLCDQSAIADFLKVRMSAVPIDVETLSDPKTTVVNLARSSRSSAVREALVPHPRSGRRDGPEYAVEMMRFANDIWSIDASLESGASRSLGKAVERLRELAR